MHLSMGEIWEIEERGTCVVVINDLPEGVFLLLLGIWLKYERDTANCRGIGGIGRGIGG